MYLVTVTLATNGDTLKTETRALARAMRQLANELPEQLEVTVVKLPTPKPVKFKNVA